MSRRYRRYKSRGGGGSALRSRAIPFVGTVFGCVALLISLIVFGIAIGQLDTAYTTAATYTDQVGLTDVMGIWGMIIFVVLVTVGLAALGGAGVMGYRSASGGGWMNVFMGIIYGGVSLVIGLIMNGLIVTQLHTAQVTVNATTNVASFSGLVSIMTIWGMVIFLTILGNALAGLVGAGMGAYRTLKGGAM